MIGDDIIKALREAIAYKRGELTEADGVKVFTSAEELFKSWEDDNEE